MSSRAPTWGAFITTAGWLISVQQYLKFWHKLGYIVPYRKQNIPQWLQKYKDQ